MGIHRGPNIEKGGLVFGYDTGYGLSGIDTTTRFYRGKPTTNYLSDGLSGYNVVQGSNWNGATPTYTLGTSEFNTPIGTYNTSGTSYMYSHDLVLDDDLSTLSSQVVTFSVYLKRTGNVADVGIRVYDNVSGYSTSYVPVTNNFQRFYLTKTLGANPTRIFVMIDNTNGGVIDFHSPMLEKGTSSPFVDGIRGGEESLIDLTKTTDIDVSNVSFDSTGQPTFDGTNDGINLGDQPNFDFTNGICSIEAIVKFPSTWTGGSQYPNLISKGASAGWDTNGWSLFGFRDWPSSGQKSWGLGIRNGATNRTVYIANRATDKYLHIVATLDGTTMRLYENGVEVSTNTQTINPAENTTNVYIGRGPNSQYFPGDLPVSKIYSRTLSPDEIRKNYKAYKNRFNL